MKEYTFEEFCQLPMTMTYHLVAEREYTSIRSNKQTGIAKIAITPNEHNGYKGKTQIFYSFDRKSYDTADQVYVAYMAKACGVKL